MKTLYQKVKTMKKDDFAKWLVEEECSQCDTHVMGVKCIFKERCFVDKLKYLDKEVKE